MTNTAISVRRCPTCAGNGRLFALASGPQLYPQFAPCQVSEPRESIILCRACKGSGRQYQTETDLGWQPAPLARYYLGVARGPRLALMA